MSGHGVAVASAEPTGTATVEVRRTEHQPAAGCQHPSRLGNGPLRVLEMFDDVVHDNYVETPDG